MQKKRLGIFPNLGKENVLHCSAGIYSALQGLGT